ncbi:MAG: helix-turn-helix domain-containing protein [Moorellales bacterium]
MGVHCRLSAVLGEKRMRMVHLAEATGISRGALRLLYWDRARKLDFDILARLCKALNCQPGDLLYYTDEEEGPRDDQQAPQRAK